MDESRQIKGLNMKTCYKHTHPPRRFGLLYFEGVGCPMCKQDKEIEEFKIKIMCPLQRIIYKLKRIFK